jgi:hypothetical protein
VRAFGLGPIVRAHLGAARWDQVLPAPLCAALGRIGWADWLRTRYPHFLSDNTQPERWMKLFFLAAAGAPLDGVDLETLSWREVPAPPEDPFDAVILGDALRSMCLHNQQVDHHFVVASGPARGAITIDLDACVVRGIAGPIDPAPPRYLFPPSVAARLRGGGVRRFTVEIGDPCAVDDAAALILEGRSGHGAQLSVAAG